VTLQESEVAQALLAAAVAVDVLLGEPPARLHPVVWMGRCLRPLVRSARAGRGEPSGQLVLGAAGVGAVAAGAAVLAWAVLAGLAGAPWLWWPAAIWLLTSSFAVRGLARAAAVVRDAVAAGDVPAARRGLQSLCARSADELDEGQLCSAAIESVAENASDSVVAPLLFFAIAGVPGAIFYRAVNTADAMVGYRGRFEYLGKAAARLDDALNWVPARLTAALLVLASASPGALRVWRRDARLTESPNAGHPMAAMAGALSVRLEKPGCYALHSGGRVAGADDVARALRVYWRASALAVGLCLLALGGVL